MLQRMNELAVQAANGTNSESDRTSIQNEIDQLTTEIDRVAETTKFNETYLLKGGQGFHDKYMAAHDAGLDGKIADLGSTATFTAYVNTDTDKTIAGKEYHIYDKTRDTIGKLQASIGESSASSVTINGTTYVSGTSTQDGTTKVFKYGEDEYSVDEIKAMVVDGAKVRVNGNTTRTAVDATLDKNIAVSAALDKMKGALKQANTIGVDADKQSQVAVNGPATAASGTATASAGNRYTFSITKQTAHVAKDLGLQLHVGADADMTNKITVGVQVMSSANLGIQNLNVVDGSGTAATYAIDAIEDAIKTVSAQRSALGAVQNRLEHTIKNLDNVVENTTAAESRIRDTDMADEMVKYSKNNILTQAGQSMLAQANQSTQGVLSLLQ
jgi:flagellin